MKLVYSSLIILTFILTFITGVLLYYTQYYHSQIPVTPNKEFKIVAYYVPEPFSKGHLSFVIECDNTELQKQYGIIEGKLYFLGYVNKSLSSIEEGAWVGGISCTEPLLSS